MPIPRLNIFNLLEAGATVMNIATFFFLMLQCTAVYKLCCVCHANRLWRSGDEPERCVHFTGLQTAHTDSLPKAACAVTWLITPAITSTRTAMQTVTVRPTHTQQQLCNV